MNLEITAAFQRYCETGFNLVSQGAFQAKEWIGSTRAVTKVVSPIFTQIKAFGDSAIEFAQNHSCVYDISVRMLGTFLGLLMFNRFQPHLQPPIHVEASAPGR